MFFKNKFINYSRIIKYFFKKTTHSVDSAIDVYCERCSIQTEFLLFHK